MTTDGRTHRGRLFANNSREPDLHTWLVLVTDWDGKPLAWREFGDRNASGAQESAEEWAEQFRGRRDVQTIRVCKLSFFWTENLPPRQLTEDHLEMFAPERAREVGD